MDTQKQDSLEKTRKRFEKTFMESSYYDLQTADDKHLNLILDSLELDKAENILDLGTGGGFLAFPIAEKYRNCSVTGLDIISDTLKLNKAKAIASGLNNLDFITYDGLSFPFDDETFDIVVSRYALHHFPQIDHSFREIYRILKPGGQLFVADPTPNECDTSRFVDVYMKQKDDGHIQFYRHDEYKLIAEQAGLALEKSVETKIRFPRKGAAKYRQIVDIFPGEIIDSYNIEVSGDEIYITEKVLNLQFRKVL